jgi:hypothetical protein
MHTPQNGPASLSITGSARFCSRTERLKIPLPEHDGAYMAQISSALDLAACFVENRVAMREPSSGTPRHTQCAVAFFHIALAPDWRRDVRQMRLDTF